MGQWRLTSDCTSPQSDRDFVNSVAKLCSLSYKKCAQWRFWSDCANAQADLKLHCALLSEGTSPQSDQRLCWLSGETLQSWLYKMRPVKILIRQRWALLSKGTSPQSDPRLCWLSGETLQPWLYKMRPVKILVRLRECAGWSESSLGAIVWDIVDSEAKTLQPWLYKMRPAKILIRLHECAGLYNSSLGAIVWRYSPTVWSELSLPERRNVAALTI